MKTMTQDIANRTKLAEALTANLAILNVSYMMFDFCDTADIFTKNLKVHKDMGKQFCIVGNFAGNNSSKIIDYLGMSGTARNLASMIGGLNVVLKIERQIQMLECFLEKKQPEYFHGLSDDAKSRIATLEMQIKHLHLKYLEEVLDPNLIR
ncbi:hypothetical protein [uncultured Parasutterella sp.]|uniref:hypothetical protein n=1 Tax=uncultured Parasutterella sp. TaxID=1263098 RepID=UPI002595A069|nr:hypothetical protein [uncultured Parasutterella sp.]